MGAAWRPVLSAGSSASPRHLPVAGAETLFCDLSPPKLMTSLGSRSFIFSPGPLRSVLNLWESQRPGGLCSEMQTESPGFAWLVVSCSDGRALLSVPRRDEKTTSGSVAGHGTLDKASRELAGLEQV